MQVQITEPLVDIRNFVRHVYIEDIEQYVREQFYGELDCPETHERMLSRTEEILQRLEAMGYRLVQYSFLDSEPTSTNNFVINPKYIEKPHANNLWRVAKVLDLNIADLVRAVDERIPYSRMGRIYRGDALMQLDEKELLEHYLDSEIEIYY